MELTQEQIEHLKFIEEEEKYKKENFPLLYDAKYQFICDVFKNDNIHNDEYQKIMTRVDNLNDKYSMSNEDYDELQYIISEIQSETIVTMSRNFKLII